MPNVVKTIPRAVDLEVSEDELIINLVDGRRLCVPLAWSPRLLAATPEQRNEWELLGDGEGIHWPAVDEDLSIEGLLVGRQSRA